MEKKKRWSEKPIPSLIAFIIGLLLIAFATANLVGLVENPTRDKTSYFIIVFGLLLAYPFYKRVQ